jgi:sulfite reductase (NADPH) flavoprotein alpha-component
MQTTPYIPDSAPFTPEQRGWLNGFLAGIFSNTVAGSAPTQTSGAELKMKVLHASQSGTGESLARKLVKEFNAKGHIVTIDSLENVTASSLLSEQHIFFITSTYGEGDPPDSAKSFFQQLCCDDAPRLEGLSYTVLALGDSHYEHFCKFGKDLDDRLYALGAQRTSPRVDCDLDVDEPFAQWKSQLFHQLETIPQINPPSTSALNTYPTAISSPNIATSGGTALATLTNIETLAPTRENPLHSILLEKRPLTQDVSSKLTLHLSFCLRDSPMTYEAGDALGVIAHNDMGVVNEVLAATHLTGDEMVSLAKTGTTCVREALTHHLQITRINRKIVDAFAKKTNSHTLLALLPPEQQSHLEHFCYDRGLIDLLLDHAGVFTDATDLVAMLPRLAPRLYSISSSPAAHSGEVHATVAVVRYRSHNRNRGGVCSTLFADRTNTGETLPLYIQPNKRFRLPTTTNTPIIMIGPGTGIAPFRSFLHERRALGNAGRNWLFFGERSATTDFLYRDELMSMHADGHLTHLDLAFSRDQERKIYVQDRMLQQASEFFRWLQDGASVYVCGDATRMAKDVDATLHTIIEQQGGLPRDAAVEYVQQLKDAHRYHRDVY